MHPVLFRLGPFTIFSYGVMLAAAFIIGVYLARGEARRKGIGEESIVNLSLYVVVAGIVGARLYHIAFYGLSNHLCHPAEILAVWRGGLAFHGSIIGGLLAVIWFAKRQKISFWKLSDTLTPSLILGQALGRIGCFLNGCCHGIPTRLPWGIIFPEGSPANWEYGFQPLHPTQLYQAILNLLLFLFLWGRRKKGKYDGQLFLLYLILYSGGRFLVEIFRGDSLYVWETPLKAAQIMGILIIIISLLVMRLLRRR
ncbi:prolipoprotein diacylglyceryl transferase [candidate division NPL-UPA2 bacterium]|nr:prolipoprotein diacylglyceryl transferase [candidate division NPL-UPA2 bacterium]